jgi:hypothetical protein
MNMMILYLNKHMLFHDEELDEEELSKYFKKLAPETLELIKMEYSSD